MAGGGASRRSGPSPRQSLAILTPLRELDQVAYLRFASVYKSFDSLDEFEKEIASLRERLSN